jgi:hypothetical protein
MVINVGDHGQLAIVLLGFVVAFITAAAGFLYNMRRASDQHNTLGKVHSVILERMEPQVHELNSSMAKLETESGIKLDGIQDSLGTLITASTEHGEKIANIEGRLTVRADER